MIGIIAALEAERDAVVTQLKETKVETYLDTTFYIGKILKNDVCVCASGTGKVNAAILSVLMIERYHCDLIMKTGIAGGIKEFENPLDVVISSKLTYHDFDVEYVDHYTKGFNTNYGLVFEADPKINQLIYDILKEFNYTCYIGPTVSGDQFIGRKEDVESLVKYFPESYACDFEACSIAHVATKYNIKFCIIQTLSDIAVKDNSDVDFWKMKLQACDVASKAVVEFIKRY